MSADTPTTFLRLRSTDQETIKLAQDLVSLASEALQSYSVVLSGIVDETGIQTDNPLERLKLQRIIDDFIMYGSFLHKRTDLVSRDEVAIAIGYIHRRLGNIVPPALQTGTNLKLKSKQEIVDRIRECKSYMTGKGESLLENIDPKLLTPQAQQYIRSLLNDMKTFGKSILRGNTSQYEKDKVTKDEFTAVSGYLWFLLHQESKSAQTS